MTYGLILAADGFDDVQLNYVYFRLREDGIVVDVASPDGGEIVSEHGDSREHTLSIESLERGYDLVVVLGGAAAERLQRHEPTIDYVRGRFEADGIIAAVGNGVRVPQEAGILEGRVVTGPSELESKIDGQNSVWTDEAVAVDGTLVTARETPCLSFFMPAIINNVIVPQSPATEARERPSWGAID